MLDGKATEAVLPFRVAVVAAVAVLDRIAAPSVPFLVAADDDATLSVTLLVEQQAIRSTIVVRASYAHEFVFEDVTF